MANMGNRNKYVYINGVRICRSKLTRLRQLLLYECNGLIKGRRETYILLKKNMKVYGSIEVVLKKVDHYLKGGSNEESN